MLSKTPAEDFMAFLWSVLEQVQDLGHLINTRNLPNSSAPSEVSVSSGKTETLGGARTPVVHQGESVNAR